MWPEGFKRFNLGGVKSINTDATELLYNLEPAVKNQSLLIKRAFSTTHITLSDGVDELSQTHVEQRYF